MIENIKARLRAKRYDIWNHRLDPRCREGYWYANGKIWYGHPLLVFFESAQNQWFDANKHL